MEKTVKNDKLISIMVNTENINSQFDNQEMFSQQAIIVNKNIIVVIIIIYNISHFFNT